MRPLLPQGQSALKCIECLHLTQMQHSASWAQQGWGCYQGGMAPSQKCLGWCSTAYLYGVEHPGEIGINDSLPLLRLHAHNKCVPRDACIVHQYIHRAPGVHSLFEQPACACASLADSNIH